LLRLKALCIHYWLYYLNRIIGDTGDDFINWKGAIVPTEFFKLTASCESRQGFILINFLC
jgi:hypothetical protein